MRFFATRVYEPSIKSENQLLLGKLMIYDKKKAY
jgi:hypothetical protein